MQENTRDINSLIFFFFTFVWRNNTNMEVFEINRQMYMLLLMLFLWKMLYFLNANFFFSYILHYIT
jgi:hypothetical protein